MLKRGGLVFFDKEVADPRSAIPGNQRQRKQPPLSYRDKVEDARDGDRCSNQMEQARGRPAMFGNIVWPKLRERVVVLL